ncbi:hypothetical protein RND71_009305 [Anisodus tanguticus]|uniref:Uncharacterized protein n=1 Tax=Anisodus tanguticus TaxID=243964 RepID=A0AAE1SHG8_9SOLA|nr:hypothetical protein RND71_009305 [Anisodus tanguticus]
MVSPRTPLAHSSKKPPRPPVTNTSSIKDKEEVEKVEKLPIRRNAITTMRPNEAIESSIKSPALQLALSIIRSAGTKAQHKKIKAKGKSEMLLPKSMGMKKKRATSSTPLIMTESGKGTVIKTPEDHENIPTIKSFEIDIKGKAKVGILDENPSKKRASPYINMGCDGIVKVLLPFARDLEFDP